MQRRTRIKLENKFFKKVQKKERKQARIDKGGSGYVFPHYIKFPIQFFILRLIHKPPQTVIKTIILKVSSNLNEKNQSLLHFKTPIRKNLKCCL